ncbi:hypothetical protein PsYK624_110780 [Phanerochaete sordida]|uniref:Uncharacterized protein n=1 Tax=Phanerochaete sordida TaxID=48140 RepID=A0A9P3LI81_9APHY|nr:hypothetical protein PsYK624_110780 [Phanerochaete sordida]
MQRNEILHFLLLLLFASLAVADGCDDNTRRRRDDSDNGDSCSSSSHHSSRTSSSTSGLSSATGTPLNDSDKHSSSHGGVSGGAIAGIVVGVVLGSLLLLLILFWLHRKRRQQRVRLEDGTAVLAAASQGIRGPHGAHATGSASAMRTYGNMPPSTAEVGSGAVMPLVAAAALASRGKQPSGANITRSATRSSLPNPYDANDEPLLANTNRVNRDRDLPPTPAHYANAPTTSLSGSPSSFPAASDANVAAFLARENTNRTTRTSASTLHDEMAAYQKRLEAHHEKEMQVRDDHSVDGPSSMMPLEPPPEYRESIPTGSTSDLGEMSHGTVGH